LAANLPPFARRAPGCFFSALASVPGITVADGEAGRPQIGQIDSCAEYSIPQYSQILRSIKKPPILRMGGNHLKKHPLNMVH